MNSAPFYKKPLFKFCLATLIAVLVALIPPPAGLEVIAMRYIGIFVWLILLMSMSIFPEYLCALFALTAMLVFKIGTVDQVFAQFCSSTLWQIIAILGLAAAIQKTTVLTRVAKVILKPFPPTYGGQVAALILASMVMNLLIPSIFAKIIILAPIALGACERGSFAKSSKPAAGLFCAIFVPAFILSNGFTTGNSNVQVTMAFIGQSFSFIEWLRATWVWTLIMTVGTFAFIMLYYAPKDKSLDLTAAGGEAEKTPLDANDRKAAVIIALSLLLWMTESLHGISSLAVTFMALCAFAALGILSPTEFCTKIDWKMVVLIGGILSIAGFISSLGISTYLAGVLGPVLAPLVSNVWVFIPVLAVLVFAARFIIVSQIASLTIFIAIFAGLVAPMGINKFVLVFCVNMVIQLWATNYNNMLIKPAYAITKDRMVVHKDVAPMAYALFVLSMIAYVASIPLWQSIGYLP